MKTLEIKIINLVASPSTPSMATRAAIANTSHSGGTNALIRHRSSSATNPSGVTSPFSPPNINSNHIDHSAQSMSPPSSSQQPISSSQSMPNTATRTNPQPASKTVTESTIDTSLSVRRNSFLVFLFQTFNY